MITQSHIQDILSELKMAYPLWCYLASSISPVPTSIVSNSDNEKQFASPNLASRRFSRKFSHSKHVSARNVVIPCPTCAPGCTGMCRSSPRIVSDSHFAKVLLLPWPCSLYVPRTKSHFSLSVPVKGYRMKHAVSIRAIYVPSSFGWHLATSHHGRCRVPSQFNVASRVSRVPFSTTYDIMIGTTHNTCFIDATRTVSQSKWISCYSAIAKRHTAECHPEGTANGAWTRGVTFRNC